MTKLVVAFRNFANTPTNPTIPFSSFPLHVVYQPPFITFDATYSWYGFGKQATELVIYSPNQHVLATMFRYSYSKPCPGGKYGISYRTEHRASTRLLGTCCKAGWSGSRQTRVKNSSCWNSTRVRKMYFAQSVLQLFQSQFHTGFSTECGLVIPISRALFFH